MQPPSRLSGPGKPDGKPSRISITVPEVTYRSLLERSNRQGRSISSLAAFLLERAIASDQKESLGTLPLPHRPANQLHWPSPGSHPSAA